MSGFSWAFYQLKEGRPVSRKDWPRDWYLELRKGKLMSSYICASTAVGGSMWKPSQEDILSTDWEVYYKSTEK